MLIFFISISCTFGQPLGDVEKQELGAFWLKKLWELKLNNILDKYNIFTYHLHKPWYKYYAHNQINELTYLSTYMRI